MLLQTKRQAAEAVATAHGQIGELLPDWFPAGAGGHREALTQRAAAVAVVAAPVPAAVQEVSLAPSRMLVDTSGRVRIYHGMNVVYKTVPWYPRSDKFDPQDSLTDYDMDLLSEWGFNVVRLGVMWTGVEIAPGVIDQTYLDEVLSISRRLAKRGIYTLVDLHQDLLSRHFCGEGVPEFYVDELLADPESKLSEAPNFPWSSLIDQLAAEVTVAPDLTKLLLSVLKTGYQTDASGSPSMEECHQVNFLAYYLSDRVQALFLELYEPETPLNHGMKRYWKNVAETFAGEPQVVGFELLNEPFILCTDFREGGACTDQDAWLSGTFGLKYLAPLYEELVALIRTAGAKQPIYFESISSVPIQSQELRNLSNVDFAYHNYCVPPIGDGSSIILNGMCSLMETLEQVGVYASVWLGSNLFGTLAHQPNASMLHGFVTELGAVDGSLAELEHIGDVLDFADGMLQSWAYWELKKFRDFTTINDGGPLYSKEGRLDEAKLKALSRTYAQAIAGQPTRMSFDRSTGAFELTFIASDRTRSLGAPTEIYLNEKLWYPAGYDADVWPAECTTQQRFKNRLHVLLVKAEALMPKIICRTIDIRIHPRSSSTA